MEYITAKEAGEKWGISMRSVQQYCVDGKIDGAAKVGNTWMIPIDCQKPEKARTKKITKESQPDGITKMRIPMPLLNIPFELGEALKTAEAVKDADLHNIAMAEYYYFTGNSAKTSKLVEKYLDSDDLGLRLSACWLYAYASLALDEINNAKKAMYSLKMLIASMDENTPKENRALVMFVSTAASVLLHLPLEYEMPSMTVFIGTLPAGLRLFALYIYAHYAYLNKEYGASVGIAETALALEEKTYPIPTIYLHLIAVMDYVCMKNIDAATKHMLEAWEIAKKDDLIEAFGEHHGLLGGMLEAVIKKQYPEEFKRMIAITYKFSAGWRKIHNPDTGNNVADTLSTTEFAVSMMTSRNYTTKEIASLLGISENTVKYHINHAMQELGVSNRKDLKKFMLT